MRMISYHAQAKYESCRGRRKDTLYLQYIRGLSENVEKSVKDMKITTVFKMTLILRCCLTKVKTPADPINTEGVVYRITCECGRVMCACLCVANACQVHLRLSPKRWLETEHLAGEKIFGAHFRLSLWSKMFCAGMHMRKPTRLTTPFQVTAVAIS